MPATKVLATRTQNMGGDFLIEVEEAHQKRVVDMVGVVVGGALAVGVGC